MGTLLAVGLAGRTPTDDWSSLLAGRELVARDRVAAERALPAGSSLAASYDEYFAGDSLDGVPAVIADDLAVRAASRDVAYLVPGLAWAGDATVAATRRIVDVGVAAGTPPAALGASGRLQIVDALELAIAEQQEPFGGGLCLVDQTAPALLSNWRDGAIARLATTRLARYGRRDVPPPDRDGFVVLPAVDMLAASQSPAALRHIYARLRRPDGCPWDREQTELATVPHILEEAEELREALEHADWPHAAEELGDVLGNALMIAQIAHEQGRFDFEDVVAAVSLKLVRRHPHVFGDARAQSSEDVLAIWRQVKQQEREQRDSAKGTADR